MPTLSSLFAPKGALAAQLKGFQARDGQLQLAEAIAKNIADNGVLLAEAGTGTGKSFAYLIPLLLSGKKAIVSTATKNLQEQLYTSDLPLVKKVLKSPMKTALLKGRRNYFCQFHYAQLLGEEPRDAAEKAARVRIDDFAEKTLDGDLVNLHGVAEDDPIISAISSTADNCLGRECEFFEQCFVRQARQKAKDADVVIVNHHLLLADFALKSDGFGEILPDIEAFVIDEAHHLPEIAVNFLGERFSYRQVRALFDDINKAMADEAPDVLAIKPALVNARHALDAVLLTLQNERSPHLDGVELLEKQAFWQAIDGVNETLFAIKALLQVNKERGKMLANVSTRLEDQLALLASFLPDKAQKAGDKPPEEDISRAQWLEINGKSFVLNSVPVNAAGRFAAWIARSEASWSFLSATLAVGGKFDHFRRELGLDDSVTTLQLGSPFDYRKQAVLYHPQGLPDPNQPTYTEQLIERVLPVIERTQGRAFLLFTSYRALHIAEAELRASDFTLLVQGHAPKAQLLADFRSKKNALLLATASFWEGVDVRGDRLVCVVIDKLPFAAPNDPVTKARHRLLKEKNLAPFIHDTLPQAVITLKQGVGRLIRDAADYGVLMIGDPRLTQKGYGKTFLESLPRMTRTTKLENVQRFFDYHEPKT